MTSTTEPRDTTAPQETGPDGSPRDHWTALGHLDGSTTWKRHTWPVEVAGPIAKALADGEATDGARIIGEGGTVIGRVVSQERFEAWQAASDQLERQAGQPTDEQLHPAIQGPLTGGEALLIDTDDVSDAIAHALALINLDAFATGRDGGLSRDDVTAERERILREHSTALIGATVEVAWKIRLWPDTRGVVPVRAWCGPGDAVSGSDETWLLAYYIEGARGLYARPGNGIFGDEWAVVTGSGRRLRDSFTSREIASEYARAIAAALPGIDWRVFNAELTSLPDTMRTKLVETNAAWTSWGPREQDDADR